jgi:hypothetical protein
MYDNSFHAHYMCAYFGIHFIILSTQTFYFLKSRRWSIIFIKSNFEYNMSIYLFKFFEPNPKVLNRISA